MKLRAVSLKSSVKLTKLQTHSEKKRKDSKTRNEREDIIIVTTDIRDYYKQFYANRLDDLEEMDTFLET